MAKRPPRNNEGRPSKYDPKFIKKIDDYLVERQDEEDEFHKTRGEKSDSYERTIRVKLPTIEGFAKYIGVDKTTLYEWKEKWPQFSHSLEKILDEQRERLLDNGLAGTYSPVIARLVLSANHGMREKSDITTDGKELPSPIYGGNSTK